MIPSLRSISAVVILAVLAGCAPKEPSELLSARRAYDRAARGPAKDLAPAELHIASVALADAVTSFEDQPRAYQTLDLAYVAERKAQMAEAHAAAEAARGQAESAATALAAEQAKQLADAKAQLAASEQFRLAAVKALADLAAVKEDERGLVITLSGGVLFTSNSSTLLQSAQAKLDQVSAALMSAKERPMVVEGHTDSQGTDSDNVALSQRRAEAVRAYLVQKGSDPAMVTAKGIGEARPVGDNATPEGRANNRRVEIVVLNPPKTEVTSIR